MKTRVHIFDATMIGMVTGPNPATHPTGEPVFITVRDKYGEVVCVIETAQWCGVVLTVRQLELGASSDGRVAREFFTGRRSYD